MGLQQAVEDLKSWLISGENHTAVIGCVLLTRLCDETLARIDLDESSRCVEREDLIGEDIPAEIKGDARSRRLRDAYQGAIRFIDNGRENYRQHVASLGRSELVELRAPEVKGRHRALCYLRLTEEPPLPVDNPENPIVAYQPENKPIIGATIIAEPTGHILYQSLPRADIKLTRRGRRMLGDGDVVMGSWRRRMFVGNLFLEMAITALFLILTIILLAFQRGPVTGQNLSSILTSAIMCALLYAFTIRPFFQLNDDRIIILSNMFLKDDQDPAVLEKLANPMIPGTSMLRVSRYESTCSVCGSAVRLRSGGAAWPGRIIGSCVNSSIEHVFDFDRFSRTGRPLRHSMLEQMRSQNPHSD